MASGYSYIGIAMRSLAILQIRLVCTQRHGQAVSKSIHLLGLFPQKEHVEASGGRPEHVSLQRSDEQSG